MDLRIHGGIMHNQTAMFLGHGGTGQTSFGALLEFSLWAQRGSPFWIGDLLLQAEATWGDDFYQHIGSGWSLEMINRYLGVARAVPKQNRVDGLSWSHHSYVTKVPLDLQFELLMHAKIEGLTSSQFRTYVKHRRPEWDGHSKATSTSPGDSSG